MPEYLAPGVYVEEIEMGPKPIEGVGTSTAGFLGQTERGPTAPRLLTSFADFERLYGGFELYKKDERLEGTYLAYGVDGFFRNGGKRCYLGRVTADERVGEATLVSMSVTNTLVATPAAIDFGEVVDGEQVDQTLTVTNHGDPYAGDPEITITDVDLDATDPFESDFTGPVTLGPGESTEIVVTFTVDGTGAETVDLTFQTTSGTAATPTVEITGTGVTTASGTLAVAPAVVDFGDQVEDYTQSRTVTLRNQGDPNATSPPDDTITIPETGITITGGDSDAYHVAVSEEIELSPGESTEFEVSFTPTAASELNDATLQIDDGTNTHSVDLDGTGIDETNVLATNALTAEAIGPGVWGENVSLTVEPAGNGRADLFKLTVRYWTEPEPAVTGLGDARRATLSGSPAREEVYDDLSASESSPNYYRDVVNGASAFVEVDVASTRRPIDGTLFLAFPPGGVAPDPATTPNLNHYQGEQSDPPGERTGLAGFADVDEINFVVAPDEGGIDGLTDALETHCVNMTDRFAVLQANRNAGPPGSLRPPVDSTYAAFYYPWIKILDPATSVEKLVPPGGHVAGIYARSDVERGVHKAPANEVVRGVRELQLPVTKGVQDVLNPRGVNCIRTFPARGIRLWGARTTSSDPSWKYVNVRRLFLFLEESIDEGTQWVVFEPNNEKLWARVRDSITNFLTTVWRDGALMGTTPDEAFFVKCDRSTMTQDDLDNGRLIAVVGVAVTKPAEFVIIRIGQWTADAEGA